MARLKYDPWMLALHLVDGSASRRMTLSLEQLSEILTETRRVPTIHTVQVRGIEADPGELPDLVERARMIALAGFPQRILYTTGEGMRRQEAEEVLRAFTHVEFSLPSKLAILEAPLSEAAARQVEDWLRGIEYYARVKQAWQLSAELVVRVPARTIAGTLCERLDGLVGRAVFRVQRAGSASAFSLAQQQAGYGMKLCEEPYRVLTFNTNGQMTGCSGTHKPRVQFGSLREQTLTQLWEGEPIEAWRATRAQNQCQGCPGMGTTVRRPSLISIYDAVGEQRFHEYPQRQLQRAAEEAEGKAPTPRSPFREIFCKPRQAS